MVMAREKFVDDNNGIKTKTPEKEKIEQSLQHSDDKENDIGLSNEAMCRQSCVRWADIVKKGRCKRPVPPVMGGAKRRT